MKVYLLTLFPEIFQGILTQSILKRARDKKLLKVKIINIRDFAQGTHKTVDDSPYGGGKGMVMKVDVLYRALSSIKPKPFTILLSASGEKYNQQTAKEFSKHKSIALICGHYEGIDERIEKYTDNVISIGDYILTGGEIPAMVIIDSITRLIPGVIQKNSLTEESFSNIGNLKLKIENLLEYPQYTRPENFKGQKVPPILLSGNHLKIKKWREEQSLKRTRKFRPDLLNLK